MTYFGNKRGEVKELERNLADFNVDVKLTALRNVRFHLVRFLLTGIDYLCYDFGQRCVNVIYGGSQEHGNSKHRIEKVGLLVRDELRQITSR